MSDQGNLATNEGAAPELRQEDLEAVRKLREAYDEIRRQLGRVIVGQDQVIEELLIALFSRGHCILEGVPGLAKTLMISTLSKCLSLAFSRIQFTPDLMPSDDWLFTRLSNDALRNVLHLRPSFFASGKRRAQPSSPSR